MIAWRWRYVVTAMSGIWPIFTVHFTHTKRARDLHVAYWTKLTICERGWRPARYRVEAGSTPGIILHDFLFSFYFLWTARNTSDATVSVWALWMWDCGLCLLAELLLDSCDKNDFLRWIYFFALRIAHTHTHCLSDFLFFNFIYVLHADAGLAKMNNNRMREQNQKKGEKSIKCLCVLR